MGLEKWFASSKVVYATCLVKISYLGFWNRFCDIKDSMLRPRSLQWARTMQPLIKPLPKPRYLCLLGRFSPISAGTRLHCGPHLEWQHRLHGPYEPHHHHGLGCQHLDCSFCLLLFYLCHHSCVFNPQLSWIILDSICTYCVCGCPWKGG